MNHNPNDQETKDEESQETTGDDLDFQLDDLDDEIIDLESEVTVTSEVPTAQVDVEVDEAQPAVVDEVDQVLSEPPIAPQDEDALSRLVREAMQRAVESARGSESGN